MELWQWLYSQIDFQTTECVVKIEKSLRIILALIIFMYNNESLCSIILAQSIFSLKWALLEKQKLSV